MDLKAIVKNFGYPALFAVLAALVAAWQAGVVNTWQDVLQVVGSAAVAFFLTKFNSNGGSAQPWFTKNVE